MKKSIKRRAKQRGISVSRLFEKLVADQEEPEVFTPAPGSAAYELSNLIPESEKKDRYDYDKLRFETPKEKYDLK